MKDQSLTNENLRSNFLDNFEMVNFAIRVARDYIKEHESGSLRDILKVVKEKSQKNPE